MELLQLGMYWIWAGPVGFSPIECAELELKELKLEELELEPCRSTAKLRPRLAETSPTTTTNPR